MLNLEKRGDEIVESEYCVTVGRLISDPSRVSGVETHVPHVVGKDRYRDVREGTLDVEEKQYPLFLPPPRLLGKIHQRVHCVRSGTPFPSSVLVRWQQVQLLHSIFPDIFDAR